MKVVYVAGPFRGQTQWHIAENIRAAERIGLLVANAGAMPLIPHANTAHFHGLINDQFWIDGTLELLKRCDAAVFMDNWQASSGARGELDYCVANDKPWLRLDYLQPYEFGHHIGLFVKALYGKEDLSEERGVDSCPATERAGKNAGFDPARNASGS